MQIRKTGNPYPQQQFHSVRRVAFALTHTPSVLGGIIAHCESGQTICMIRVQFTTLGTHNSLNAPFQKYPDIRHKASRQTCVRANTPTWSPGQLPLQRLQRVTQRRSRMAPHITRRKLPLMVERRWNNHAARLLNEHAPTAPLGKMQSEWRCRANAHFDMPKTLLC